MNIFKRNFTIANFAKFFIVCFLLMLLLGCEHKETVKSYTERRLSLQDGAVKLCTERGQHYLMHYTADLSEWEVICIQKSPFRAFTYELV